jgi:nucleotide-binding universal stress UspA family protein
MFKRILVPVDLSDRSGEAVDAAAQLAVASNGSVLLLHVIETIEHIDFDELRPFYKKLEDRALQGMERLKERAAKRGVRANTAVLYGPRARCILDFAGSQGTDLIIMTSHRIDPSEPGRGLATISYEVGVLARCPVLLLK